MAFYCSNCLLPFNVPGAEIDQMRICKPCRDYKNKDHNKEERKRREHEEDIEKALRECKCKGEYDCIVSFSGGKDSVYLLYKVVKEYRLRVLAYTCNFDIPKATQDNIRRTVRKLNVDHIVYTPPLDFYRKSIRYLLRNQNEKGAVYTVCYFLLDLREGDLLRLAMEKGINLILTGYSPGQPDQERMLYEMPTNRICNRDWTPYELFEKGLFDNRDKERFWNPKRYHSDTGFPRILAPFHAWKYDQGEIIRKVVELGLISNRVYANPVVSNFTLNWLLMYSDLKNLGYNPYMPEFSQLIREGKASRSQWRVLVPAVNFMIRKKILMGTYVKKAIAWLDLKPEELAIRK